MKWFLDVAYLAINSSYKWLLGMMAIIGIVVGALFAAGVLGGSNGPPTVAASLTPLSTSVPKPVPTPTATPTVPPSPSPAPTALPRPTLSIQSLPTPTATPAPNIALPIEIVVPIFLEGVAKLGSLEFVLRYEPTVLEVTKVEGGTLASNALWESSTGTPGLVWVGMIDANGMSGDGPAAVITFNVIGNGESSSSLILENVVAHDATTLIDIIIQKSPGSFTVKDLSLISPSLGFLP